MKHILLISAVILSLIIGACAHKSENDISPLRIERLDEFIYDANRLDNETLILGRDSLELGLSIYMRMLGIQIDSINLVNEIRNLSNKEFVSVFSPDVARYMPSLSNVELRLGDLSRNANDKLSKINLARVYGVVSPYMQSIVISDSIAVVSLNLYLGPGYPGYRGFEDYFKSERRVEKIPVDISEALIAINYPFSPGQTPKMIDKMLYEGALVYATTQLLPDVDVASVIGVSADDLAWFESHESDMWDALVSKDLLYSSNQMIANKLISPAPNSSLLMSDAPARAARYLGYKIVMSYIDNNRDTSIEWLLSPEFYNGVNSLIQSNYSPRND